MLRDNSNVFGSAAHGFHLAVNGEPDGTSRIADRLSRVGTVDAMLLAIEVLHMSGKGQLGERLAGEHLDAMMNPDIVASSEWMRTMLLSFYARKINDTQLLASAEQSNYPMTHAAFAHWAIALRHISNDEMARAKVSLQACVDQRQFVFHSHPWAQALLARFDDFSASRPQEERSQLILERE